jgi:CheY-like chemotaxis protein
LDVKPDLVITGIYMPEVDGFRLIKFIKAQSNILIIAITGVDSFSNSENETLGRAKLAGADFILQKSNMAQT